MTRPELMYDNVTVAALPRRARAVAGYIDGAWPTFHAMVARFYPHAHCVSITVFGHAGASFCDCENGDLTPEQAIVWVEAELRAHRWRPGIYANLSTWHSPIHEGGPTLLEAVAHLGSHIRRWVADYDGIAQVPAGFDAKQYTDHGPGGCDVSVLAHDFFPVARAHHKPRHKSHRRPPVIHPKVTAAGVAGALTTAAVGVLSHHGIHLVHLAPAASGAITAAAATIAAAYRRA